MPTLPPEPHRTAAPATPAIRLRHALLAAAIGMIVLGLSTFGGWYLRSAADRVPLRTAGTARETAYFRMTEKELVKRGKLVYQIQCNRCHGPEGRGDGPSAAELKPPPRDFHAGLKFGASQAAIRKVIAQGLPGTAMPSSGQAMSASDLDAVAAFVGTLASAGGSPGELSPQTRSRIEQAGFVPIDSPRDAPELELYDASGKRVSLARFRGKLVLLNFWGTACSSCIVELPRIERLADELREQGLEVLCPCADEHDPATVASVAGEHVQRLPALTDPTGATCLRYDVRLTPTACLIDPAGRWIGRSQGAHQWSSDGIEALLQHYAADPAR